MKITVSRSDLLTSQQHRTALLYSVISMQQIFLETFWLSIIVYAFDVRNPKLGIRVIILNIFSVKGKFLFFGTYLMVYTSLMKWLALHSFLGHGEIFFYFVFHFFHLMLVYIYILNRQSTPDNYFSVSVVFDFIYQGLNWVKIQWYQVKRFVYLNLNKV